MAKNNRTGKLTKGAIRNNSTKKTLRFQYNPESFTDDVSVKYRDIESPGISYPIFQYTGGDVRTIEFTLFLDNVENSGSTNKITSAMSFIDAFLPPANKGRKYSPPPTMTFSFGWFVKDCVLESRQVEYTMFDRNLNPLRAEVTLRLRVIQ